MKYLLKTLILLATLSGLTDQAFAHRNSTCDHRRMDCNMTCDKEFANDSAARKACHSECMNSSKHCMKSYQGKKHHIKHHHKKHHGKKHHKKHHGKKHHKHHAKKHHDKKAEAAAAQ